MDRSLRIRSRSIPLTLCFRSTLTIAVPGSVLYDLLEISRKVWKLMELGPSAWNIGSLRKVWSNHRLSTWENVEAELWDLVGGREYLSLMLGARHFDGYVNEYWADSTIVHGRSASFIYTDPNKKIRLLRVYGGRLEDMNLGFTFVDSRPAIFTPEWFATIVLFYLSFGRKSGVVSTDWMLGSPEYWDQSNSSRRAADLKERLEEATGMALDF